MSSWETADRVQAGNSRKETSGLIVQKSRANHVTNTGPDQETAWGRFVAANKAPSGGLMHSGYRRGIMVVFRLE